MRSALILLVVALSGASLATGLLHPVTARAQPDRLREVQDRLARAQGQLERSGGKAEVLTSDIAAFNRRIAGFDDRLAGLREREAVLTRQLDSQERELGEIQADLRAERSRLIQLRARLEAGRRQLAARLVELYKSGTPDLVTVILNADGFASLLEDAAFVHRISQQDQRVLTFVEDARDTAQRAAVSLAASEQRQQRVTASVAQDTQALAEVRQGVEQARQSQVGARGERQRRLQSVRVSMSDLRGEVSALRAVQSRIQSKLQQAQQTTVAPASPAPSGSGAMIWPVNGPITSPFCEVRSYESCHPGLDIGVPEGTPIRAAASGTVVLMQPTEASGGYGNYTCLQHGGGISTCYAHQSRFGTTLGASVTQGQVIGYVGNTGHSFGAHLHFEVRVNGAVTNPLNYL